MSICRSCRRPILWTKREDGGYNPPLNLTQELVATFSVTLIDGEWKAVAVDSPMPVELQLHYCEFTAPVEPDNLVWELEAEYRKEEKRLANANGYESGLKAGRVIATIKCPTCGAKKGENCVRKIDKMEMKTLHPKRWSLA